MQKNITILLLLSICQLAKSQKAFENVKVKDTLTGATKVEIQNHLEIDEDFFGTPIKIKKYKQLIPEKEFDKYILGDIQRFIILSNQTSTYPSFSLDALEKNISLNYSRQIRKKESSANVTDVKSLIKSIFSIEAPKPLPEISISGKHIVTFSVGVTAEWDANSSSAPVYKSGAFVNNLKGNFYFNFFANGRAKFDKRAKQIYHKQLLEFINNAKAQNAALEDLRKRNAYLQNETDHFDEKLWLSNSIDKLSKTAEKDSLLKQLNDIFQSKAPFYKRKLAWFSIGLDEIGTPSYKTFDIAAKDDKRFDSKRIFIIHPRLSYSWLHVDNNKIKNYSYSGNAFPLPKKDNETIFFFTVGSGIQRTSNIGQNGIKSKDYIEEVIIANGPSTTVYEQTNYKAYKLNELGHFWRASFQEELLWLFFPKAKAGISQRFEYYAPLGDKDDKYITQLNNRLGFVFPIQNKKDKAVTLIQLYWKCEGFVKEEFVNQFGFKVGIPINVPMD